MKKHFKLFSRKYLLNEREENFILKSIIIISMDVYDQCKLSKLFDKKKIIIGTKSNKVSSLKVNIKSLLP